MIFIYRFIYTWVIASVAVFEYDPVAAVVLKVQYVL